MTRERSAKALRREALYGAPLRGPGWPIEERDAWPDDARVRIGTSGWAYRHWLGRLYPRELPGAAQLAHYARRFPTVEVNATYYRLPSAEVFARWRDAVPEGFRFTIKSPGSITHDKRLVDVGEETRELLRRASVLGEKLGLLLFQFPPGFHADLRKLADFLDLLPAGGAHAVELRHRSWFERDVYRLLADKAVAFVVHDHNKKGTPIVETAPFTYLRLHGTTGRYRGRYPPEDVIQWSEQIRDWRSRGFEVWSYLNNDERGKSVLNALELTERVGDQKMLTSAMTWPPHVSSRAKSLR